ncbi:MAG: hypothetical protein ABIS18_06690, partial [Actinomycetota bacterium]
NVFNVEKGMRRHVPSPTVFDSRIRWSRVVSVPSAEITRYTPGPPIGFRDGIVIRTPTGGIFVISDGFKRMVESMTAFGALGFNAANVKSVSQPEADLHPTGQLIR